MLKRFFGSAHAEPMPDTAPKKKSPDFGFHLGTVEALLNSLCERQSFTNAFDGMNGWATMDRKGGGKVALNHRNLSGGILFDQNCEVIFGNTNQIDMAYLVIDLWTTMRDLSYSGWEDVGDRHGSLLSTLPLLPSLNLVMELTEFDDIDPLPNRRMQGTKFALSLAQCH